MQQIYHDNDLKVSLQQQNCIDLCPAVCPLLKIHSMLNDARMVLTLNFCHAAGGDLWNIMDVQSSPCD